MPPDADLAQYVLAKDQVQQVPGCAGWTDVPGYDMVEFIEEVPGWVALFEGLDFQDALEASGCGRSEGTVEIDATQVVFRFASQEGATQFMERLRVPAYPFLVMSEPLLSTYASYRGTLDFETWFQELDPQAFGPGAFAVETSAALPALLEELVGLRGTTEGEAYVEELLATRTGPFYTMEQFEALLENAYRNLKEGASLPAVEEKETLWQVRR